MFPKAAVPFSVCRDDLRFVCGFGNIPEANFTSEASLAVLATITFPFYVNNPYVYILALSRQHWREFLHNKTLI